MGSPGEIFEVWQWNNECVKASQNPFKEVMEPWKSTHDVKSIGLTWTESCYDHRNESWKYGIEHS